VGQTITLNERQQPRKEYPSKGILLQVAQHPAMTRDSRTRKGDLYFGYNDYDETDA
jgi:hypothetical protein